MQLRLDTHWTEKLARLPESGMGYQRVRVRLKAGQIIDNALVFNANILDVPAAAPAFTPEDIAEIELVARR